MSSGVTLDNVTVQNHQSQDSENTQNEVDARRNVQRKVQERVLGGIALGFIAMFAIGLAAYGEHKHWWPETLKLDRMISLEQAKLMMEIPGLIIGSTVGGVLLVVLCLTWGNERVVISTVRD